MEQELLSRYHGRELTDHDQAAAMLDQITVALWSKGGSDIGCCVKTEPIKLEVKDNAHVCHTVPI